MSDNIFINAEIDTQQLPHIQHLEQHSLSEKYASTNVYLNAGFYLLLLLISSVLYCQLLFPLSSDVKQLMMYIILAVAILGSLSVLLSYQSDIRKSYTLRDLDIHYSSGLFFRKTVSQPITRIQHIELKRGPIDRKIGLAKLQVFSAGGSMHTFEIPGLPVKTAQQLRQFIIAHKDVAKHG